MKRTDLEKKERKIKRQIKKEMVLDRKMTTDKRSVNEFIDDLFSLFLYDQAEIFNTTTEDKILDIFEEMMDELPEKQWENVIRKAIKKTKISQKEKAFNELKGLLE